MLEVHSQREAERKESKMRKEKSDPAPLNQPTPETYRQQDKRLDPIGQNPIIVLLGTLNPLLISRNIPTRVSRSRDLSSTSSEIVDTGSLEEIPRDSRSWVRSESRAIGNSVENTRGLW
jgi:hypothetical protein